LFELNVRELAEDEDKRPECNHKPSITPTDCIEHSVNKFINANSDDLWSIYKLARMCARYAYFELAESLYMRMYASLSGDASAASSSTSDLSYTSWLEFMSLVCRAESLMSKSQSLNAVGQLIGNLNEALSLYTRAQLVFKSLCTRCLISAVAVTSSSSTSASYLESPNTCFAMRYAELRSEQIKLYVHLILSSLTYATVPAPAFQLNSSDPFARFGRLAQQMKYSCVELQKLTQKYKELIAEWFDADEQTLNILNMYAIR
jgi:hypothetical protein